MPTVISLDSETYYDKECSVKTLNADCYTRHPKWNCYMVSASDGETHWAGPPAEFNWEVLRGATVVSHNSYFDEAMVAGMQRDGKIPADLGIDDWFCTANLSAYLSGRRSLANAAEFFYGEKPSKAMRNYMEGRSWEDAIKEGRSQELLDYAKEDARLCVNLWNDHSSKWPEWERKVARITTNSGKKGVKIDVPLLRKYIEACHQAVYDCEQAIPWVKHGEKPTSPKAMAEECRRLGIECSPVKSNDEDGYTAWDTKYSPIYPWVKAVGDWRSVNNVLTTLKTIPNRLRDDDSIEASLKYFGAHTGRWSGEGGINFQNFRKEPLKCGDVEVDVRRLIVPRPGKKMIASDLAQIEPRVSAWLCGNHELLAMMAGGMSIYEAFARTTGQWSGGDLKKENKDLYQLLKIQVLGLGYGCGWEKFITIAAGYGMELTQERSKEIVTDFRSRNLLLTGKGHDGEPLGLWKQLENSFKRSVADGEFKIGLPSGRDLTYRKVKRSLQVRSGPDDEIIKDIVTSAEVLKTDRIMRIGLYGGLLCENLVQAAARDVFAYHLVELAEQGLPPLFTSHDEWVGEVDEDVTARDIEEIMSKAPPWMPGLPVGAEAKEMPYYLK